MKQEFSIKPGSLNSQTKPPALSPLAVTVPSRKTFCIFPKQLDAIPATCFEPETSIPSSHRFSTVPVSF
jgi:hypothetical protein